MIRLLFDIIIGLLFTYIALSTVYLLIIAIAGKYMRSKKYSVRSEKKRIAVIIPSYKEDNIIFHTAQEALAHNYDRDKFEVIVIADNLHHRTVENLRSIVRVIEVDFKQSMKARSLHAALKSLSAESFDIAVILDADNVMAPGCLEKINHAFQSGHTAIQCHRTAKNKNTPVALLDAVSEEININLFRRGPALLGLSASPIGSGMGFEFKLINEIFSVDHILNNPGEDREIDLQLMKRKIKMEFINDAYVFDEKVSSSQVFERQRIRWLEAQVNHLRRFFDEDMKDAPKTLAYFNKILQTLLLPRLLFLILFGFVFFILVIQQIFSISILYPSPALWLTCMAIYMLTLFISIPSSFYNRQTISAIAHIPVLMLSMMKAIFKMKKNRTEFLHTPKNVIIK